VFDYGDCSLNNLRVDAELVCYLLTEAAKLDLDVNWRHLPTNLFANAVHAGNYLAVRAYLGTVKDMGVARRSRLVAQRPPR
jgi:hypothetical protein